MLLRPQTQGSAGLRAAPPAAPGPRAGLPEHWVGGLDPALHFRPEGGLLRGWRSFQGSWGAGATLSVWAFSELLETLLPRSAARAQVAS